MRVLTWNLFHGRSRPPAGRELLDAFGAALAGWDWDVALLQEVPPWWPRPLAERSRASMRMALTSRNELLPLRRAVARTAPDLIKSGGGGANAILVRGGAIADHRRVRLRRVPERRIAHAVRLHDGTWVMNVHAEKLRHRADDDVAVAWARLDAWARGAPAVFGGDLNLRDPVVPGFAGAAHHWVDHVFIRGLVARESEVLDAGALSDHRPVLAILEE
jgi:endonuclease/exonuclease/phosphatase family metal-dependent hydrolase